MKLLNLAHLNWQECTEINDSLLVIVDSCAIGFHAADSAIQDLKSINSSLTILNTHQVATIDTLQGVINDQKKIIHKLKTRKTLGDIFSAGLIGIIGYLVIFK